MDAVVPMAAELSVHPRGRMVVCKAFDHGTAAQREAMAEAVVPMFADYGTAAQRELMVEAVVSMVAEWSVHPHGSKCIQI